LARVKRVWPGETVCCIATGPSLTPDDVLYVRGRARVIAINDAIRLAPWADCLYSSDRHWWPTHRGVPSFTGLKYGLGSGIGKSNPFSQLPDITVLKNTGYTGLETDPKGLRNGKNSGYASVNLAYHLGAARIILLGFDMGIRDGRVHFFGSHVGMNNPSDAHFVSWRKHFATIVEPLQAAGVSVVNCTPSSALDCFPMADLRETLRDCEVAA
jgi:hypothetical protein